MTTLAKDQPREFLQGDFVDYPVIADDIIYQGAGVGENGSGYSRPLQAGDRFQGFADYQVDNAGGAAGAKDVRVRTRGKIRAAITSIAITANDQPAVYMSDDNTFTLSSTGNSLIGYVERWVSTGVAIVYFDAALVGAALHA